MVFPSHENFWDLEIFSYPKMRQKVRISNIFANPKSKTIFWLGHSMGFWKHFVSISTFFFKLTFIYQNYKLPTIFKRKPFWTWKLNFHFENVKMGHLDNFRTFFPKNFLIEKLVETNPFLPTVSVLMNQHFPTKKMFCQKIANQFIAAWLIWWFQVSAHHCSATCPTQITSNHYSQLVIFRLISSVPWN